MSKSSLRSLDHQNLPLTILDLLLFSLCRSIVALIGSAILIKLMFELNSRFRDLNITDFEDGKHVLLEKRTPHTFNIY